MDSCNQTTPAETRGEGGLRDATGARAPGNSITVGAKIFILVGFCLGLLALVSGIGIWQMNKISEEIREIAQEGIPLTRDLTEITIYQLEQTVNFERAFRAGKVMNEHAGAREEFENSVLKFKELTGKIEQEFTELNSITQRGHNIAMADGRRHELHSVMLMVEKLSAEHMEYDRLAKQAFKLIDAGQIEPALALLPRIEAGEEDIDHQLTKMLREVESATQDEVKQINEHEKFALKLLVVLTDIALIIGTGAAIFIVRRSISRPLKEIVTGLEALGADDMSVEVNVHSDDEIGAVARAYAAFKLTLIKLKGREMELEASRRRFKNLVESTNVVPWEFDPDSMCFTYVGPQAVDLFGYRLEDWYAEGFWVNVIHADDREEAVMVCKQSARRCENHDLEYRTMTADGGEVWVRDVSSVVREDGRAVMFRGVFIDITAKKISEVELRESEQRFRDIAEVSSDWIWEMDENLRFSYHSTRYFEITGFRPEDKIGTTRTRYVGPADLDRDADKWAAHMKDLEARRPFKNFEFAFKAKDGATINARISGTPVFDAAGAFKGYRGTGTDRTKEVRDQAELVRHRDQLQESQELLSKSFHASPVAIVISSPEDGAYIDVNEAWCAMFGYSHAEALASTAYGLCIWADASARDSFVAQIGAESSVSRLEIKLRTKDGRMLDVLMSGEQVEIGGQPRLLVVIHDITEHKSAERELINHRDHLQEMVDTATQELNVQAEELKEALCKEKELNEIQRQFVSMASHEFRTPLAIIDSAAQRLLRRADSLTPQDLGKRVGKIRGSVRRMTELMESTLVAAQLDAGRTHLHIGDCDIDRIIGEVCGRQQEISHNHVIKYGADSLPATFQADTRSMEQIFTNLLSNAVKYAPDAPQIDVKAWIDGENILVTVRDHGLGIDEDDLPNLFQRYFRAKTSTGIAGTGIGLNLVKTLVELHGGKIAVESGKGEGSLFTVCLPIRGPAHTGDVEQQAA